ncbi:MAG: TetR family transcriptional regulator [Porticoccaceae bacterium]|jgi:TetR/AcrR family transcriptional repressor of bet genes|nr:TetR family transcriptional regulator [Porticoccaceae bacterium]MBT3797740.1 TetR family transcriptional regulator [Porticoccaceae bacterium]MBT4164092.1 TetR family transcriptional regulator [Porticoccaceae bacterium]MBT4211897.1 TetR family transcriptional regulator [Porticoccaceae bacterium]MBT4590823.1 TetR family transcriptional regulator [Porticoccaceae bacterium]
MEAVKAEPNITPRSLSKQARRKQLIEATIKCIADKGLSGTTMADVTQQAGLSLGIVNLHFQTKEKLLIETLSYISNEYTTGLNEIFNDEKLTTEQKILAHINFDFSRKITDRNKLAVWFAFWGETKSRPTYMSICASYISEIATNLTQLFAILKQQGGYSAVDPDLVCTCYTALSDGLWLDLLMTPKGLKPAQAQTVAMHYLTTQFPDHFKN